MKMNVELIYDHDELFRRIVNDWVKEDGSLSSAAFQNTSNTNDMSVNLARLTTPKETISEFPHCGVAKFLTKLARALNQQVLHDPIPKNIAHTTVKGNKTKSIKKN